MGCCDTKVAGLIGSILPKKLRNNIPWSNIALCKGNNLGTILPLDEATLL